MTARQFRCGDEPVRTWLWGGISCPSGTRPLLDQLITRMLALPPADRARWLEQCLPRRMRHAQRRTRARRLTVRRSR